MGGGLPVLMSQAKRKKGKRVKTKIKITLEEGKTEEVPAANSSERCENCGRGSEVLAFEDLCLEPESGPANLCRRCLGWMRDYVIVGASIRCHRYPEEPDQAAVPETGACYSCDVEGLTVYRFRVADTEEPEEDPELAFCRQCLAGGFAFGYGLVVEGAE